MTCGMLCFCRVTEICCHLQRDCFSWNRKPAATKAVVSHKGGELIKGHVKRLGSVLYIQKCFQKS